jgi:carbon-monoxide dehydrogenase iron sulfur subunit
MKVIGIRMDRCTGCKTCELYCGAERGSEGKTLLAAVQETPAPQPRVRVEGARDAAIACRPRVSMPASPAPCAGMRRAAW